MSEALRAAPAAETHELTPVLPVEPPAEVLARLREIDGRAQLAYVGEDTWLMGRMMPLAQRQELARKLLAEEERLPVNLQREVYIRILRLYAQGFRVWGQYSGSDVHSGRVVLEFRKGIHGILNTSDAEAREASLAASSRDHDEIRALVHDFVEAEFRELHRIHMRHRLMTYGRHPLITKD